MKREQGELRERGYVVGDRGVIVALETVDGCLRVHVQAVTKGEPSSTVEILTFAPDSDADEGEREIGAAVLRAHKPQPKTH